MKIIKNITEDEMIAVFMKAEIGSFRFGGKIFEQLEKDNKHRGIVDNPDISNQEDNNYRKKLLGEYRGYGLNRELFENFPTDVSWKRVGLNKADLEKVKYINYDYWVELSNGSRLVKDGAKSILAGIEVFKNPNKNFLEAAESLKQGFVFPEIILVARDEKTDLVVLEGHLRLTAYLMEPNFIPEELEAIVGFSKDFDKWGLY
jgi:hypothetical protein